MLRYNLRYQIFLIISDVLVITFALFSSLTVIDPEHRTAVIWGSYLEVMLLAIAVWLLVFFRNHIYRTRPGFRLLHTYNQLVNNHLIAAFIFMGLLYITLPTYPRIHVAVFSTTLLVFLLVHRTVVHVLRRTGSRWINSMRRVIIIGDDAYAYQVGSYVRDCLPIGLDLVGFVSQIETDHECFVEPILGTFSNLPALLEQFIPDEVIISVSLIDEETVRQIDQLLELVQSKSTNVRLAPDFLRLAYLRSSAESFNGMMLIGLRESILSPFERLVKRVFDIGFSLIVLLITAPLYPVIVIAIALDSAGPIIFRQKRVGQYGKHFTMLKFRTMRADAEAMLGELSLDKENYYKSPDDPRITRVGRWLRRFSLDELPQFINVLLGEMSVVGPRPELIAIAESFSARHRKRLEVPQGITGWWQINGRADYPLYHHISDDLYYIENYSIWLDILIILRTLITVIRGRGAY